VAFAFEVRSRIPSRKQDVLVELHLSATEGLEKVRHFVGRAEGFFDEIVSVNIVDADRADDAVLQARTIGMVVRKKRRLPGSTRSSICLLG